jgi:hypothetical protein
MKTTKNYKIMKATIAKNLTNAGEKFKRFKVRLDYKTFITIKDLKTLDMWKTRYPKAKVIGTIFV